MMNNIFIGLIIVLIINTMVLMLPYTIDAYWMLSMNQAPGCG